MKKIADAGLLISFLDRADQHHEWAMTVFRTSEPPFYTAEPILGEAIAVLGHADQVLSLVETGDLVVSMTVSDEVSALRTLLGKYKDQGMDLGDACCIRLAELITGSTVYTVDETDFTVYRKHGRYAVPCVFPPKRVRS